MIGVGFFTRTELMQVSKPASRLPLCGACGLLKTCASPKMPVAGEGRKGILIVGESPGATEDREGKPFVGESGVALQKALRLAGVELFRDCWATNALSCKPVANRKENLRSVEYCRPLVTAAIEQYDPRVVLLVGKSAVESVIEPLYGESINDLARWVGLRIPHLAGNRWLCPTWHPSYLMRERGTAGWTMFRAHVAEACKLKGRPYRDASGLAEKYELSCEAILDPDDAAEQLQSLDCSNGISFDFETTSLKPDGPESEILCCSVSNGKRSIAFPWVGTVVEAMRLLLTDSKVRKIGWNAKFEDRWIRRKLGIRVGGWCWDGMLASHLLDPRTGTSGLGFQAFTKLGIQNYWSRIGPYMDSLKKGTEGGNAPNRLAQVSKLDLLTYCAKDSLLEFKLARKQVKELGSTWPLRG